MFFISFKKLFPFSRYSNFCISVFPFFLSLSAIALEVESLWHQKLSIEKEIGYDIETLSTERVLNKEHFYGKIIQNMCTKS